MHPGVEDELMHLSVEDDAPSLMCDTGVSRSNPPPKVGPSFNPFATMASSHHDAWGALTTLFVVACFVASSQAMRKETTIGEDNWRALRKLLGSNEFITTWA